MIGGISLISLLGWVAPFGLGGRHWFQGPQGTISKEEVAAGVIEDGEGRKV
jgi:hypothetical protein